MKATAEEEKVTPVLVPKLRFPEFRGADGWDADALGVVANFVNEKVPLERVALENYISTENILPDYGGIAKASKLPTTGAVTRYRPNDTLVSNIRPYLKKVWVADKEGGASNDVIVIRAKQNLLPQYFSCLLKNDAFIDYVMTGAKGVKMPRGDVGSMKAYRTLYPSKAEQQKIAECLSSVDDLIAAQARKVAALKTHKIGLMQQLFPREGESQPRLRFPEFQRAGDWSKMNLGQAATFYNGRAYKQEELLESGKYPVLRVGNFFTNKKWYYSDLELDETKYCDDGDLLYAWSASFGPRVWLGGKVIYHYHIWKVEECQGIDRQFLFITLDNETERMKAQSANGLGLLHITKGTIEGWDSSFPPQPPEQQRIATCLSSIDTLITTEAQKLEAIKTHKKGLMQQLFPSPGETLHELHRP
jgi:type I restriction enzyme S subunit